MLMNLCNHLSALANIRVRGWKNTVMSDPPSEHSIQTPFTRKPSACLLVFPLLGFEQFLLVTKQTTVGQVWVPTQGAAFTGLRDAPKHTDNHTRAQGMQHLDQLSSSYLPRMHLDCLELAVIDAAMTWQQKPVRNAPSRTAESNNRVNIQHGDAAAGEPRGRALNSPLTF